MGAQAFVKSVADGRRLLVANWEMQAGRLFLWLPVAFGFGAAAYLCLPFEPQLWWIAVPFAVLTGGLLVMRRLNLSSYLTNFILVFAIIVAGAGVAKLRTEHVRAPVLSSDRSTYSLTALVIDNVSPSAEQPRLLVAPIEIRGVAPSQTPLRLRIALRPGVIEAYKLKPGDTITTFALLNPPPSPSIPGGYDFARTAFFQGVGGVGFIPGQPEVIQTPRLPWRLAMSVWLNRIRWQLTQTLADAIRPAFVDGPSLAGFASALVTGQQAYVPENLVGDMRDSGLAHILSISGVHMAVVGGFIFLSLRGGLAMIPWLVLRMPVKKLAAGLSIMAVLLYLAISGCPAPAVRSAVVAIVAFAAVILDRRALSLRALAIAAFVVILLTPEAVIQPGFQMSFCATAALLALAEVHVPPIREVNVPVWVRAFQSSVQGVFVSLQVSVVATLATTPFAIAYFNRFTVYGLLSNLFEAPITAFVVMPGLAVGTVGAATPIGPLALRFAGSGLWLISQIANWTAHLPGSVIVWASAPDYVLVVSFIGVIWACLVRGRLRWLGLVAGLSIFYWPRVQAPDVWIDPQGGNAAIHTAQGAYVLRPKVRQYGYEQWTRHYSLTALDTATRDKDYDCAGYACTLLPDAHLRISFWFSNKPPSLIAMQTFCLNSDLIVLRSPLADWPAECSGVNRLTSGDFKRLGAMELTRASENGRGEWRIRAAQPLRGDRYWSRPSLAETSDGT